MNKKYIISILIIGLLLLAACKKAPENDMEENVVSQKQSLNVGNQKGELAPQVSVTTVDGEEISLSELTSNDQPVLMYFWASWCPFCKRDLTTVKDVYPKYKDKVKFVAMDLDEGESEELIKKYRDTIGISDVDFVKGDTSVLRDYGVTHTTTKYAISRDGVILYKGSGAFNSDQWETLFKGLSQS